MICVSVCLKNITIAFHPQFFRLTFVFFFFQRTKLLCDSNYFFVFAPFNSILFHLRKYTSASRFTKITGKLFEIRVTIYATHFCFPNERTKAIHECVPRYINLYVNDTPQCVCLHGSLHNAYLISFMCK